MRRKEKGPRLYEEWDEALSRPLDYETAAYLSRGTLRHKELYAAVFNRISGSVTDDFNSSRLALDTEANAEESVFALKRFISRIKLLGFYEKLDFLKESDKRALRASLSAAARTTASNLRAKFGSDNPDMGYEIYALERALETDRK